MASSSAGMHCMSHSLEGLPMYTLLISTTSQLQGSLRHVLEAAGVHACAGSAWFPSRGTAMSARRCWRSRRRSAATRGNTRACTGDESLVHRKPPRARQPRINLSSEDAGAVAGHELLLHGFRAAHNVEEDSVRVRRQVRTLAQAAQDRICADISEGVEAVSPAVIL